MDVCWGQKQLQIQSQRCTPQPSSEMENEIKVALDGISPTQTSRTVIKAKEAKDSLRDTGRREAVPKLQDQGGPSLERN